MNLLEYVQSLGSDISLEEKIALTKDWKKKNEPVEDVVEEVKPSKFNEDGSLNVDSFSEETKGAAEKVNEKKKTAAAQGNATATPVMSDIINSSIGQSRFSLGKSDKIFEQSDYITDLIKQGEDRKKYEEQREAHLKQLAKYEKKAKFDEIYSPGDGYQYKFSLNKESNTIEYFTKSDTEKDFIKVNPSSSNGNQQLIGLSVANKLGHLEGDLQEQVEAILKQNRITKNRLKREAEELALALEQQKTAPEITTETDERINVASLSSNVYDKVTNYINKNKDYQLDLSDKNNFTGTQSVNYTIDLPEAQEYFDTLNLSDEELKDRKRMFVIETERRNLSNTVEAAEANVQGAGSARESAMKRNLNKYVKAKAKLTAFDQSKQAKELQDLNIKYKGAATTELKMAPTDEAVLGFQKKLEAEKLNQVETLGAPFLDDKGIFGNQFSLMVKEDPFIKAELLKLKIAANPLLEEKRRELSKKYNTATQKGYDLATQEYNLYSKSLIQDKLEGNKEYVDRLAKLRLVAGTAQEGLMIEEEQAQSPFFQALNVLKGTYADDLFMGNTRKAIFGGVEQFLKSLKSSQKAFNSIQLDWASENLEMPVGKIKALQNALDDGTITEDTMLTDSGMWGMFSRINRGGKTVRDLISQYKGEVGEQKENVNVQLDDIREIEKALMVYSEIDKDDNWLVRTTQQFAGSLPYMGAALAGTGATLLSRGTLAPWVATGFNVLGSAYIGLDFYGTQWYETFLQGVENEAIQKGLSLDDMSDLDRKNFMVGALERGDYDDTASAMAAATLMMFTERFGVQKQFKAFGQALGLGGEGVFSLIKGQWKQGGKQFLLGGLNKAGAGLAEFGTEFSQQSIGDFQKGFSLGKGSEYVNWESSWESGVAGFNVALLAPGGASIVTQTRVEIRNLARKLAVNFDMGNFSTSSKAVDNWFKMANQEIDLRFKNAKIDPESGEYTQEQYESDKLDLATTYNTRLKMPSSASAETRNILLDLMMKKNQLNSEINKIGDKDLAAAQILELGVVTAQIQSTINFANNTNSLQKEIDFIQKVAPNGSLITYDTIAEFVEKTGADADADAFIAEDGTMYINKMRAAQVGAITAASHERLHQILRATFANSENALKLVEDFKSVLSEKEKAIVQKRIDENYADASPLKQAEEYLTAFSDAIGKGELNWSDNLGETFKRLGQKIVQIFRGKGYANIEFTDGRDVYNFIRDYARNTKLGKQDARTAALSDASEGITTTEAQESKTEISKQNLETAKENLKVEEEIINIGAFKVSELQGEDRTRIVKKLTNLNLGLVKNLAAKAANNPNVQGLEKGKRKTFQDFEQGYAEQLTKIINNYEPIVMSGKDAGKRIPFGAYLQQRLKLRYGNVLTDLKKGEVETTSIDTKEAKEITDTSSSLTTKEVNTDIKLVDNIKIDKQPLSIEFKDKVRGFVTEQLEGLDPKSEKFRKQAFKPSKAFVDLIAKDIIGSPKKFREFLNENPTFYKGLNITELIAIDDGRVKKGQPRLFTEVNRRLTKQSEIEKFMMQGRVPYLTTAQQKAGANLYNRLTPKVAAVINNFFGSTPQNNSNRKRAIAKAIANKFIAEAAPSTEAFKSKPQDVRAKTAEKLQVSQNAKFSKTVDNTFQKLNIDAKGNIDFRNYNYDYSKTLNELIKDVKDSNGDPLKRIDMKDAGGRKRFLDYAISSGLTKKLPPMFWRKLGFTSENLLKDKTKKYKEGVKETKADIDALIEEGAIFDKSDFRGYKGNLPFRSVVEANTWISESIDAERDRLMKPEDEGGENLSKAKATAKAKTLFAKDSDFPEMKSMLTYEKVYSKKGDLKKQLNDPEFVTRQDESIDQLGKLFEMFQNDIMRDAKGNINYEGVLFVGALLSSSSSGQGHFLRSSAPFRFYQKGYRKTGASGNRLEHTLPATIVGKYLFKKALDGTVKDSFKNVKKNYFQGPLSVSNDNKLKGTKLNGEAFNYVEQTPENWNMSDNIWARYFNINVGLNAGGINPSDLILAGGKSVYDVHNITSTGVKVDSYSKSSRAEANNLDNDLVPDAIAYDKPVTTQTLVNALIKTDKALDKARRLNPRIKKIRVFDFDDTLATSKSMVIVNMPDGTSKKINATQFAQQAANLEADGAKFDFTEFSKVVKGKKGPLFSVAQKIADARGTEDVFILTARPQEAAGPIKAFMKANGIDIPLANITGLGDGTAQAKAGWMMGKAAEGYNDFYFADDAVKNVKAVKDVLSQIDVKSKVQIAKFSKTKTFDTIVNDMIEDSSGIETYKQYSAARAKTVGANKGRFDFLIPASAEDFTGLLYKMLGKGKKGDAQMAFLKTNLLDPYDRAESAVTQAKIAAANDFKELKNQLKTLPKSLSKPTGIAGFTFSHAVRVAAWTRQGMTIPGLSKKDIKELNDFVENNKELNTFTNELIVIQKGKPYPKPGTNWLGGNITSDIINDINKVNRAEYQQEFRENVDIIFSEDNMNKMEAAYGTRWREAMEDSLRRMKAGSNRPPGGNRVTDALLDWLNNSVGAVMFLNTRSALLQTISSVNFINWGDNNIVKAGLAFANQKQFWSDFMTLMNSDYLVERREGLKINVSESEIADAVRDSKNKVKSAIAFLLSKGFVMTRFADSFAIATGGATFYRNRVKALVAKGMDQKAAEKQAFDDFRQIAEESQQSSNPNRISAQQASGAGRVILAWANTPMQYARIQKRAAQDLINGRGDWKTNVSKIVYYGAVQNLIFNALQQAVFALGFGEDDEEEMDAKKSEKISRIANGMIDSQLKGLGIGGAAVVALKSALMELGKQHAKDRPKYEEAVFDLLGFSPPLGSKIQKINSGLRSFSWNMKDIKDKGFSLDNPAYLAGAQITTGLTNIPLDRVIKKINSMRGIVSEQSSLWQKVALGLGWSTWDVGLGYYGGFDAARVLTPEEQAVEDVITMKKETKTQEQVDMLLDLGLTKKEIKALGKEQARVEKIIELQKTETMPEVKSETKVEETKVEETKEKPKQETKPKTESAEKRLRRQFDSIKGENKPDQVKTLSKFGLSKKEIRALQYEKNRVEKILELMYKNKKK